jgi:type I restriction enzyme, S subunit
MTTQILLQDLFSSAVSGYWGSGAGASEVDVKIVRNGDIARDGSVRWGELPVRGLSEVEAKKASISDGDLLITTSGECGRVALVRSDPVGVCTSNFVRRIRCDTTQTDPGFAYHLLRDRTIQKEFARFTRGTTLQNLSLKKAFSSISVAVPPLEEQRRIASILDAADELRTKRQQTIDQLDTLTDAIFHDMFGDPATNDRRWPTVPFEDLCPSHLGKMLDEKKQTGKQLRPYLRNANVRWFGFDLGDIAEMDFHEGDRKRYRLETGDVLVCEGGEPGRAAVWRGEIEECYFQKALHRGKPDPKLATSEFIVHLLRILADRGGLVDHISTATIAHLTGKRLKSMAVIAPPIEDQIRFREREAVVTQHRWQVSAAVGELDDLFTSLQQRAFRGEL